MVNTSLVLQLAVPLVIVLLGVSAGVVARRLMARRLAPLVQAASSPVGAALVSALRRSLVPWSALVSGYVAADLAPLPGNVQAVVLRALLILVILSVSWTAGHVAAEWVRHAASAGGSPVASASLITNLTRAAVLALGALVILQTLGISITPIITALGVGGLAVALALQDTLANLFAGIHILATRQIRPGDFIRLDSGDEGYVQDITWRNTTIRRLPNDLVIVPNSKLAGAIITNYYLPDTEEAVLVNVGVDYDSDLQHVERVTTEVGRGVMQEVPGGVPTFEPFIRYNAFGESSITFTVILRGREPVAQYLIRHEFIKRLHARYRAEGITIPWPIRTLDVSERAAALLQRGAGFGARGSGVPSRAPSP